MRPISSIEDLKRRVPEIQKAELVTLAEIGALNFPAPENGDGKTHATKKQRRFHRRDALWQVERVARPPGPLLEDSSLEEDGRNCRQPQMPRRSPCPLPPLPANRRSRR